MATFRDLSKLVQAINREVASPRATQTLANKGVDLIKDRVRQGRGVNDEQAERPRRNRLKPLAPSTVAAKARKGQPTASIATATGQMLAALRGRGRRGFFEIDVDTSSREEGRRTNKEVQEFYSQDRPWLALTGREGDEIAKIVRRKVNELVKRFL